MSFAGTALSFLLLTALLLPTAHGGPLDAPVITLGEKKSLFGEKAQANEYVSYALYYWPDPANPEGPYKPIDGKKNQQLRSMDDSGKMAAFIGTVCSLGRQYELNRDPRAASRAGEWLRAWFIAPATRMQPHLKYAQIRPGHRTEGDGGGIIDLYRMPDFLDALAALKRSGALTKEEWKRVDAWLNQYYAWLATSRQGRHAHTRSNNHYLFYVAQCAYLAHFLGRDNEARQWLAEAFANMDRHIAPDGSQPEELKRAEPWQYSVYTLQALEQRQLLKLPLIHWKTPCSAASRHPERDVFPGNLFSKELSGGIFPSLRGFPFPRRDGIRLRPKAFFGLPGLRFKGSEFPAGGKFFIDPRPSILHQLLIDEHLSIPDFPQNTAVPVMLAVLDCNRLSPNQLFQILLGSFIPVLPPFRRINSFKPYPAGPLLFGRFFQESNGIAVNHVNHNSPDTFTKSHARAHQENQQPSHKKMI